MAQTLTLGNNHDLNRANDASLQVTVWPITHDNPGQIEIFTSRGQLDLEHIAEELHTLLDTYYEGLA